jgi:hypothetical protein
MAHCARSASNFFNTPDASIPAKLAKFSSGFAGTSPGILEKKEQGLQELRHNLVGEVAPNFAGPFTEVVLRMGRAFAPVLLRQGCVGPLRGGLNSL